MNTKRHGGKPIGVPVSSCPECGAQQEDTNGFGVTYCEVCNYCTHPWADGTTRSGFCICRCGALVDLPREPREETPSEWFNWHKHGRDTSC